jgi:hypothetical protein
VSKALNPQSEAEMLQSYRVQVEALVENADSYKKHDSSQHFGLEVECSVLHHDGSPVTNEDLRNKTIGGVPRYTPELGAGQIEMISSPIDIMNNAGLEPVYSFLEGSIKDLQKRAAQYGGRILLNGTNPFVPLDEIVRTQALKYEIVPNYYNRVRNGRPSVIGPNDLWVGEAAIPSVLNSIQPNIEARSMNDAIDKLNRLLMISPMAVSLTANARYVGLEDSGMEDLRVAAWQTAFETRTDEQILNGKEPRVGMPSSYYSGIGDYFSRIAEHPFILHAPEQALRVGIGMNWKDAKIKFIGGSAVVELRSISTQATAEENASAALFVAGRLLYSQISNEDLIPMRLVHNNVQQATHYGSDAVLWTQTEHGQVITLPARDVLALEIDRAVKGIEAAEIPNLAWARDCINELRRNLLEGGPSQRLKEAVDNADGDVRTRILTGLVEVKAISDLDRQIEVS